MSATGSALDSSYDAFAAIYSRWIGRDFAERAIAILERLLSQHIEARAPVLDLCCGCGHFAGALAARGFRVTGLDSSPKMLDIARRNAPTTKFIHGDARSFSLPGRFAAVISTFNSLAHVRSNELERVFACVKRALRPDGIFLFDLTMEDAYRARWRGSFSSIGEAHVCVVRPSYDTDARMATNRVTAFERDEHAGWHRSDFEIVQNCHSSDVVETALAQAGFISAQIMDAQHDLGMSGEAGRAFFLCK